MYSMIRKSFVKTRNVVKRVAGIYSDRNRDRGKVCSLKVIYSYHPVHLRYNRQHNMQIIGLNTTTKTTTIIFYSNVQFAMLILKLRSF